MSVLKTFTLVLSFLPMLAFSAETGPQETDPRNVTGYTVLFDISAEGGEIVNGYGAYLEYYEPTAGEPQFRFCNNFEGSGLDGRPNLSLQRMKHVPAGTKDASAYHCREIAIADMATGQNLVALGSRAFFSLKTTKWDAKAGGELVFQMARKIPLLGSAKYRLLRMETARSGAAGWQVTTVLPKADKVVTNWMHYAITDSGLGIPNGIKTLKLNPGTRTETAVNLDTLESP